MDTSTLIIGGGLSGLALAEAMEWRGQDYLLVEARDRFGGRILGVTRKGAQFDMGPAWFWPGQPRIAALIDRLGLRVFQQYRTGAQTYEDQAGEIQRGRGLASAEGSWRIVGGMSALTGGLEQRLPQRRLRLNSPVRQMKQSGGQVAVTLADGEVVSANRVVLAMPPRLSATIACDPPLEEQTLAAMASVPTWMAGHAKVMAVYQTPFWRAAGFSGNAMSRKGPVVEIHDASPADGSVGALFGFVGLPAPLRRDAGRLRLQVLDQLGRLFGAEAKTPETLDLKDWAFDPLTATNDDAKGAAAHQSYRLPPELTGLWGGQLILSGSETAPQFGGYLEGALAAAERTLQALDGRKVRERVERSR